MGADFKLELEEASRGILESVVALLCDKRVAITIGDDVEETLKLLFHLGAERVLEELLEDFGPAGLAHALNAAAAYMQYEGKPWERPKAEPAAQKCCDEGLEPVPDECGKQTPSGWCHLDVGHSGPCCSVERAEGKKVTTADELPAEGA